MSPFPGDGPDLTTARPTPHAGNPSHWDIICTVVHVDIMPHQCQSVSSICIDVSFSAILLLLLFFIKQLMIIHFEEYVLIKLVLCSFPTLKPVLIFLPHCDIHPQHERPLTVPQNLFLNSVSLKSVPAEPLCRFKQGHGTSDIFLIIVSFKSDGFFSEKSVK